MGNEKHYHDGDMSTHEAFIASQRVPLIWKILESLARRNRTAPKQAAIDPEQARAVGSTTIYKSVRLR